MRVQHVHSCRQPALPHKKATAQKLQPISAAVKFIQTVQQYEPDCVGLVTHVYTEQSQWDAINPDFTKTIASAELPLHGHVRACCLQ